MNSLFTPSLSNPFIFKSSGSSPWWVWLFQWNTHCKDKIPKFRNKYYHQRNIGVSVPISTFMRLWAIYIFPRLVCLFCLRKYVDRCWDYINRSQTHECGNWGWGRAIPRKGIHKWDFRCSVQEWSAIMTRGQKYTIPRYYKKNYFYMAQPKQKYFFADW